MDPNATLRDIRMMVTELHYSQSTDNIIDLAGTLASAIDQLDDWLTGGGPPPAEWCIHSVTKYTSNALRDKD